MRSLQRTLRLWCHYATVQRAWLQFVLSFARKIDYTGLPVNCPSFLQKGRLQGIQGKYSGLLSLRDSLNY
jgi:hypothetical protein